MNKLKHALALVFAVSLLERLCTNAFRTALAFSLAMSPLTACDAQSNEDVPSPAAKHGEVKRTKIDDEMIPLSLTGIDHLADYLSVQEFSVNGYSGAQAGQGGSEVCCVSVPRKWRPGLEVEVRWEVLHWRDHSGAIYKTKAAIEPYVDFANFYVHFLPDGTVRAIVSFEGVNSPTYAGPHTRISNKSPWEKYSLDDGKKSKCVDYTVSPPGACNR